VGELFTNGWTVSGILASGLGIAGLIWRRFSAGTNTGPSLYVRLARTGSAITKLQIAEGTLDSIKESLLLEKDGRKMDRAEIRELRTEIERLRSEIAHLSRSPETGSSDPPSATSTVSRGARTRKRRTT
jgi:hypothetical protein